MTRFENKSQDEPALIDTEKLIKKGNSPILKRMPQFVVNFIKKLIHQDEVNQQIIEHKEKYGLDFIEANMKYLNISMIMHGFENLPDNGRFIFVCNHPLGGIDFYVALIAALKKYPRVKAVANDILMSLRNLRDLFLPVNVFGRSPQSYYDMINEALASDIQVMTFPAGEVSRMRKGVIKDGAWHRSFVRNALEYQRDVIPVYIHAKNSKRFYFLGRLREKLGIKANLELFLLPDELFRQRGKTINVVIGKVIPFKTFDDTKSHYDWSQEIKEILYELQHELPQHLLENY
ncbi:MAG: 1-acyl-sn-glycerol-3-phosphate acyltransferase [Bacteroidales bacterium]|nr:1-acyl-sn-glycerol-3-phosphate acyltransferase [Bacteroidales bacterium]